MARANGTKTYAKVIFYTIYGFYDKVPFCHFLRFYVSGFELRIWRRGMGWDQERAAEELGVSLRSYKRYEKAREVARLIELATLALSMHYK
ncbi:DNA-binding transcriptional regulator [Serratia sp. SRS-8-S-2018]|uniref:helix-turn-helix domain-containing protein n=1 Tax=Serratia sp. SRS-8-S-2018 TaxID=2591107 RepID=UPI0021052E21|nr:helix-turn-helix transcriptional regulator [Serratia sp. SRS-8-S-2018]